jgi:cytochrome c oxidase subunit 2
MQHKLATLLILAALALGLAACGGGANNSGASSGGAVAEPATAAPKDTPVKITLENDKGGHGIKVDGTDINLGPGKTSTVVTLKAGTYDFHCSIICGTGHGNMKAKLIVQ